MTPNDDALRCASLFIGYAVDHAPDGWPAIRQRQLTEAGEHIIRLVAENTAQRELLRQAAEANQKWIAIHENTAGYEGKYGKALDAAIAAQQADPKQVPTLPFAVFDEFGQPCEDRIRDYFAAAPEAPAPQSDTATDELVIAYSDGFDAGKKAAAQQAVPEGYRLVPVGLLNAAAESLGNFVSDHGWSQSDMDTFDAISAIAAAPEAPAQAAPSAGEVERDDVVAFEFYNRATGHAIVDYSVNTHVGNLTADKGYEARPLVYAAPRQNVLDGSKPIPAWQAREALDELEAAARGDAPFNHQAAAVVRAALSHKEPQR